MIHGVQKIFPLFAEKWRQQSAVPPWDDTTEWTKTVLKVLRALGKAEGYAVYPDPEHQDDYFRHEYMSLDQCWTVEADGRHWMQLAVESEWQGRDEPLEDFYKLAELKCPWKVMLFSSDEDSQKKALDRFSSWIEKLKFQLEHEQYLILVFQRTNPRRSYGTYTLSGWLMDAAGNRRELGVRTFGYDQRSEEHNAPAANPTLR